MCFLLRLPFSFLLLYLAWFYRENTERWPREQREEVPWMALRVLRPKSPHFEDWAQYIEWRDPCGHAAVWLKGSAVQGRHDRQLYEVLEYCFLKKLSAFLKRLTKDLKRLTQYLTKFTHFEVYFAVPPAKFSHLYTLHFTPYTRKIALKCDFSCTSANFIVPLHRKPAPGDVCTSSAEGSRHMKGVY